MTRVDPLARFPQYVAVLSEAFAREWPEWARDVGASAVAEAFRENPDPEALPRVFVAHEKGSALGTIALRAWFADEPMVETPWVRGLYVLPAHRGRGVDRMLIAAVEDLAAARGMAALYAGTTTIEPLLVRRGWQVFRRIDHHGEEMAWLRKEIKGSESFIATLRNKGL